MNNDQNLSKQPFGWLVNLISNKIEKEKSLWLLLLYVGLAFSSQAQTFSTNRTPVGMEHNVLFNAETRYQVTISGTQSGSINASFLFDGKFQPDYTSGDLDASDPLVILIEGLPEQHVQQGAWVGWSTRGYPAEKFIIEGYNDYQNADTWVTLVDYSTNETYLSDRYFAAKIPVQGAYTKLKYTFIESGSTTHGRLGLSELFFIHPEATTPYEGLFGNVGSGGGTQIWDLNSGEASFMGNVGIGTTTPNAKLDLKGDFKLHHDNGDRMFLLTYQNGSAYFDMLNSSGASKVRILANGDSYLNGGNVGIGTNTPSAPIHIAQSDPSGLLFSRSNHDSYELYLSGSNGLNIRNKTDGRYEMVFLGNGNVGIGNTQPSEILDVAGNIKLTGNLITPGGNVGIGTSAPSAPIHIAQSDPSGLLFSRSNHDSYELYLSGSNGLNIRNKTDGRDEMVFHGNGNIGIGKTQPSEKLDVAGNIKLTGNLITPGGKVGIGTENPGVYNTTSFGSELDVNGQVLATEGLRMYQYVVNNQSFNQNIFTTSVNQNARNSQSPVGWSAKVESSGYAESPVAMNFYAGYSSNYSGTNNGILDVLDSQPLLSLWARYNDQSQYKPKARRVGINTGSPGYTLDVNGSFGADDATISGNVGIGTTAPTQKLSVNGKINAEEIILEDVDGADFVFEEDYDLRSLQETEQFIKANKHLPEIPSAAEMADEGLAIKEMNILLLQKVEELTLHLIRQEKEIAAQSNKITLQSAKLTTQAEKMEKMQRELTALMAIESKK